ncbi:MAG: hypothetical protein LQ341_000379 [Variospora aurantia]|nr:MAG: hypothetical protein LQ341_000379 [Variospora aurantia]
MAEMCHWLIPGMTLGDSSVYYIVRLPISIETMQKASQSTDSKLQGTGHSSSVKELIRASDVASRSLSNSISDPKTSAERPENKGLLTDTAVPESVQEEGVLGNSILQ